MYFTKIKWAVILIASTTFSLATFSQANKDSLPKTDDFFEQWIKYSSPGKFHQVLANLAGKWTFKGMHYSGDPDPDSNKVEVRFTGTIERKSFANGRYFIVTFNGDKIQMPIQNGKTKEVNSIEIETEGYDNIKQKFVKTRIGNHLGSDISYSEGAYDSVKKTIIFQRIETPIPGVSMKTYEHFIIQDNNHYTIKIFRVRSDHTILDSEFIFTRTQKK